MNLRLAALLLLLLVGPLPAAPTPGFRFADVRPSAVGLWEGDRPVFVYNHGIQKKAGVPDNRQRGCYVHPLYGPDGEELTDDFPVDHYHHRGLFWAWPHVDIGTQAHDLWMLRGIQQQFEGWTRREVTPEAAFLGVRNGWYVGDRRVVQEDVRFQVFPAAAEGRVIDVELSWTAVDAPVTLGGAAAKGYGGLSLRFAPRRQTTVTTADGPQSHDLNETRLAWADLTGHFAGAAGPNGVALFVAPRHPGFPPTWITRAYGFLGVGWPGTEPGTLMPGQPVTCRYRLWVHRGSAGVATLEHAYRTYRAAQEKGEPQP